MDTIRLTEKGNCRIIAHRGLSAIEPENTMPAFVAAGNRSYYGIETDVHVTSDGKYLIIHDDTTERMANGRNLSIEGNTFDLLRTVPLVDKNGKTGRIDLRCPSLEEYITICRRYGKKAILELKNTMEPQHIANIVAEIRELQYLSETVFISFSSENMVELRRLLPEQKLMWLVGAWNEKIRDFLLTYRLDIDVHYAVVTAEMVKELHEAGLEVNAWTCDKPDRAAELIAMGIDYLTTNLLE